MNRKDCEDLIALCAREVNACGLDTPAGRRAAELKAKLQAVIEYEDRVRLAMPIEIKVAMAEVMQ